MRFLEDQVEELVRNYPNITFANSQTVTLKNDLKIKIYQSCRNHRLLFSFPENKSLNQNLYRSKISVLNSDIIYCTPMQNLVKTNHGLLITITQRTHTASYSKTTLSEHAKKIACKINWLRYDGFGWNNKKKMYDLRIVPLNVHSSISSRSTRTQILSSSTFVGGP